jgi:hypothetical protein
MTDKESFIAMLERSEIAYKVEPFEIFETRAPVGVVSILVGDFRGAPALQKHPTPYGGFYSELIFDGEGKLITIWAWE